MNSWKLQAIRLAVVCFVGGTIQASEWTSWRGPDYNGVSTETGLISSWSPEGENLIWKAEFIGRSTPVVLDGQACVIGRVGEESLERQEVVACYDAGTGAKNWEHRHNVYNTTVPFNRVGWASLVADKETGAIFAHGVAGQLIAFDHDGKILWSRFLAEELGRLSGYGGRTQTPLIDGQQLILSSVSSHWGKHAAPRHRFFSFDKRTGDLLWIATPGNMPADMNTQSAPVVAEIQGRRMLISGNADGWIYALDISTGEKLWGFQLSRRGINSTVLVVGDRVYASHSEENLDDPTMGRLVCIDGTGSGDVTKTHEVWRINELSQGFPSPTYHDGRLYVVDNSANLMSIVADSGEIAWEHNVGTVGKGSPVFADGKLYITETNGRFHIIRPGKEGATVLDSDELHVADGRYAEIYGSAAIAYGRIYFTTEGGVYCIGDKSKAMPGFPTAEPERTVQGEGEPARLIVVPAEVLVAPGEKIDFEVRAFDAKGRPLGSPAAEWKLKGLSGTISNGNYDTGSEAFEAGMVSATVGGLTAEARVRVVSALPWAEDFASYEAGQVPGTWVSAPKKWAVQERDGEKVLVKLYRPKGLLRNALYMGPSTMSNYTIQVDVYNAQKGRRRTDSGIIAGGYTLDLMGNHQKLQLRSWPSENRITTDQPYEWEVDRWYVIKLRVDVDDKKARVRGKAWPRDGQEPDAWSIELEDPYPIQSGSPGLVGYSPADVLFDNIKVTVND